MTRFLFGSRTSAVTSRPYLGCGHGIRISSSKTRLLLLLPRISQFLLTLLVSKLPEHTSHLSGVFTGETALFSRGGLSSQVGAV